MLATWLAALLFLVALQALLVVKLADRLTVPETAQDHPAQPDRETRGANGRYAQAAGDTLRSACRAETRSVCATPVAASRAVPAGSRAVTAQGVASRRA